MPVSKLLTAASLFEPGIARDLEQEVRDLARDRPRRCDGCNRRMRYWPTENVPVQRAGSRGGSARCHACQIAPELIDAMLHKRPPDLEWILDVRARQIVSMAQQLDELLVLPATAEGRRACDRLCCLLQQSLEELERIERYRSDTALVDELLRTGRASHPGVPLRGVDWHAAQA